MLFIFFLHYCDLEKIKNLIGETGNVKFESGWNRKCLVWARLKQEMFSLSQAETGNVKSESSWNRKCLVWARLEQEMFSLSRIETGNV